MRFTLTKWSLRIFRAMPWVLLIGTGLCVALWWYMHSGSGDALHQASGNIGQYVSGTIGTLLAMIAAVLLIITLAVQINEYKLTRDELINTVKAQQAMAESQAAQLQPLKDQARISQQTMEMDLLARAILDLKDDIRTYTRKPWTQNTGCIAVTEYMTSSWSQEKGWLNTILNTEDENTKLHIIGWTAVTLIELYVIVERAVLILSDLDTKELPETPRIIRRKELILHVKSQLVPIAGPIWNLRSQLYQVPEKGPAYENFRSGGMERAKYITDRLMEFMAMDVAVVNQSSA
ncbi:MAG: hypothetical protein ABI432_12810 [Flavobacteriales bacterium]